MTIKTIRLRQFPPSRCQENSFRTISLTDGVQAVICRKEASGVRGPESGGEAPTVIGVCGCDAGLSDAGLSDRFVRFVDTPADEAEWQFLHRVADAAFPEVRDAFLRSVAQTQAAVVQEEVEMALELGDTERAFQAIPWEAVGEAAFVAAVPPQLQDLFVTSAQGVVRFLPVAIREQINFDLINPKAVEFIRTYGANLVQQVSTETQLAIRELMVQSFTEGIPPRQIARDIREVVGLTRSQARAVTNFRRRLEEFTDWEAERVDREVEKYYQRTLRRRAELISRTETLSASNRGAYDLHLLAREQGLLDPTRTRRHWLVTPDERLEGLCMATPDMNAEGVGLDEPFQTPVGPVLYPPLHPGCRCTTVLKFLPLEG